MRSSSTPSIDGASVTLMADATSRGPAILSGIGDVAGNCARAGETVPQVSTRPAAHTGIQSEGMRDKHHYGRAHAHDRHLAVLDSSRRRRRKSGKDVVNTPLEDYAIIGDCETVALVSR